MHAAPSASPPAGLLPLWPRRTQAAVGGLLLLAVALLALHGWNTSRYSTRPADLVRAQPQGEPVDLNRADHAQLVAIPGLSDTLAERILAQRRTQGAFRSLEELRKIKGIGPATLERLRPYLIVEGEDSYESEKPSPGRGVTTVSTPAPTISGPRTQRKSEPLEPIDINLASAEDLKRLPGIGEVLAQRILATRRQSPFRSVDELRRVSGIGPKTMERLRPYVTVNSKRVVWRE